MFVCWLDIDHPLRDDDFIFARFDFGVFGIVVRQHLSLGLREWQIASLIIVIVILIAKFMNAIVGRVC